MNANLSRRSMFKAAGATAAAAMVPAVAHAAHTAHARHDDPKPAAGKQGAGFYAFNIGTIQGAVLTDGWFGFPNPHPMVAPEASKDEFDKVMRDAFLDPASFVGQVNPVVLKIGKETVLIDAGGGTSGSPTSGRLLPNLVHAGYKPEQITGVVISHAHSDHIGGLLDASGKPAFPNAKIFMSKTEHAFWSGPADSPNTRMAAEQVKGMAAAAAKTFAALKDRLELVAPGDKILGGLDLIDGNGHTPGHLCVAVENGPDRLFVMGDLVHHHVAMFHNPDWTIAFDTDPKAAAAARRRIFPALASERTLVLAYHLPWPGFGRIGRHGDSYWWAQEQWIWD